ncbi:MAG: hypothetical protein MJ156_02600, partial [Alphaproteobacteria bacterium]|nr:hypothetical protein [Alphaproteobacteria bacterium]
ETNQPFPVPDGLTFMRVNRSNGVAASKDPNGIIITEVFKEGQGPNPAPEKTENISAPMVGGIF